MTAAARNKNNQFANTSNPQDSSNTNMDAAHDATDAANGLFMLAKGGQTNSQFAAANQVPVSNTQDQKQNGTDAGESPESHEDTKPTTRGSRGKKAAPKAEPANRRKSEAVPKGSNKRSKGNSGAAMVDPALDPHDDEDDSDDVEDMDKAPTHHPNGKKMTDEEKRRNFLERNRYVVIDDVCMNLLTHS
jgi:ATF/CREB family transcription factor